MNFYVWTADLNSLHSDKPNPAFIEEKVKTEEEAEERVKHYQTHDRASWYTTWDSEDKNHTWDSENPCLSLSYKNME